MKALQIEKVIIYIAIGALIIFLHEQVQFYLSYLIGAMVLIVNGENLFLDIKYKKASDFNNKIAEHISFIIIGIILFFQFQNQPAYVSIIWAGIIIIENTNAISKFIYSRKKGHKIKYISMIDELVAIILAIILLTDPIEHVSSHIIILGAELILKGIRLGIDISEDAKENI